MKIAFLTFYSGFINRGVETFVYEVANRLAKRHQVCVFQSGFKKGDEKYKVIQIKSLANWTKKDTSRSFQRIFYIDYWSRLITKFAFKCLPYIRQEKYDVVIPTDGGWEVPILRAASWLCGGKMIISGQAGFPCDYWNIFWRPNLFIALTNKAKKKAKNKGVKVAKIPNGVDLKKFHPQVKPTKISLFKPIILCASALTPSKRIDLTIKAVAKLKNASLLVVGEGDLKDELEKLGKKLLKKRFLLTSAKHEEMPRFYTAADLFTMVSVPWEAFGIVYVEAMASGLPVVATDDETRREIIGAAGFFVDPKNIEEYAKALEKALKTNFGDKPCRQAQKFSWDKISREYENIIGNL